MLKKLFDHLSSHVTVWTWAWPYASTVLGFGIVSGFIAKTTEWVAPWGAIGWWFCALAGALIATSIFLVGAIAYHKISDVRLKRKIYGTNDRINPLESFFERKRVSINDLAFPYAPIVKQKTFEDCDLVGPCNIVLTGNTLMEGCAGNVNQAAIINVKPGGLIVNAIIFHDCVIRNCRLYQVTFFIQEEAYDRFSSGYKGLPWITQTP